MRIEDGGFHNFGFDGDWGMVYGHPETKISFAGIQPPKFKEMASLCEKLHDQNPYFGLIAWDVVLDIKD